MSERIRPTGTTMMKLRDVSATLQRLDVSEVAKALGAEPTDERLEKALAPLTLFFVREKPFEHLQSSGGRPGLEGATRRAKIPLSDPQW